MEAISAIILLFAGVIPGLYLLIQYNTLAALRNQLRELWRNIHTELKRRYDLVPRLVEIMRRYMAHECETLDYVTALRDRCTANHGSVYSQAGDEAEFVSRLQALLAHVETYSDLKADAQFQDLHRELVNTESAIQVACHFYNGKVRDYRNKCEVFPSSLIAQMFGFKPASFFEVKSALPEVSTLAEES